MPCYLNRLQSDSYFYFVPKSSEYPDALEINKLTLDISLTSKSESSNLCLSYKLNKLSVLIRPTEYKRCCSSKECLLAGGNCTSVRR